MENNNVNSKSKSKKLMALIVSVFVVCMAGLMGIFFLKNNLVSKDNLPSDGTEIKKEMVASDAATLRELLLADAEIAITLTEDVRIDETLYVNGTKKLLGDHSILMELYAEPYQGVLTVSKGADLILDGITIDGNGIANGVTVKFGGGLTCNSADIIYGAPYALDIAGKAVVKDVLINETIHTGVNVSSDAEVYWEGGTIQNTTNTCVAVAKKAYMKISGDSIFENSDTYGIINYGKIDFADGIVRNAATYLVYNDGEFNVTYEGENEDDRLEWHTCKMSAIRSGFGAVTNVKNLYIHDVGQYGVRLYHTDGGTTITNCVFEDTKRQAISILNSTATLKDIKIADTIAGIIVEGETSVLELENIDIKNITKGRGIENHSGKVTGKNIVIDGVATYGITTTKEEEAVGSVTVSDVVIKNCGTDNAFNSNGSVINVTNAEVYNTGRNALHISNGGVGTFKNVKVYDTVGLGLTLLNNSTATITNVKLIRAEKNKDSFVTIDATSKLTMNGDSAITGCTGRGVYNTGTFIMNDGEISNNGGKEGRFAAGIRVDKNGTFIMNGGSIHDNNSLTAGGGVLVSGTFEMNGGSIYNNKSNNQGGGVHVMKGSTFTMKGGSIVNNVSQNNGGGVWVEENSKVRLIAGEISGNTTINGIVDGVQVKGAGTEITMHSDFKMGSNMIKLNWSSEADKVLLRIVGNKLTKHDTELPLIVTPSGSTVLGGEVIECDSAESAKNMVDSIVSGDGQFSYYQDDKYIRVEAAHADLDMTGVNDVVAVTNYQQLKEAVTTTKEKRIIKICADIEMEGTITVPNGTTVQLTDDGVKRTLSRAEGTVSQFFLTKYGTGLILTGTGEDKLVLDAACSQGADATKLKVLLQMQGASKIENVTFTNSDNSMYSKTLIGTYVYQQFASTEITNCTFENGKCNAAGAIRLSGTATIKDCDFNNNSAISNEGGVIYVDQTGAVLKASGCTFDGNSAVRNGGAIYFREGAGASIITDCEFTNNKATRNNNIYGGAIYVSENVSVEFADTRFEGNQVVSAEGNGLGGAISSSGCIRVTDCQFVNDYASSHGGAVFIEGINAKAIFTKDDGEALFSGNTAKNWGGAMLLLNTSLDNVSIDGYTFDKNEANHGGAIRLEGTASGQIKNAEFTSNTVTGRGGAIDVNYGSSTTAQLQIKNSTFSENTGKTGGALHLKNIKTVISDDTKFVDNASTEHGGALCMLASDVDIQKTTFSGNRTAAGYYGGACYGEGSELTVTGSAFNENEAHYGGALYLKDIEVEIADSTNFIGNKAITETGHARGGAVYIEEDATVEFEDVAFEQNVVSTKENGKYAYGGAVFSKGDLTATDCQFKNNVARRESTNTSGGSHGGAVYIEGATAKVTFTKNNGTAIFSGNTATNWGGAMVLVNTSLDSTSIDGYTFDQNEANHGGAIHLEGTASGKIENAEFTSNTVTGRGGAIDVNYGSSTTAQLQIKNSTFEQNTGANGGALHLKNITAVISDDTKFVKNASTAYGGALYLKDVDADITNGVTFNENTATRGGAIYVIKEGETNTSRLDVEDAEFKSNTVETSSAYGGAISAEANTIVTAKNTLFEGNKVTTTDSKSAFGGAIYTLGSLTATDCQFKSNITNNHGGAICVNGADATLTLSKTANGTALFNGNTATSWGGALYLINTTLDNTSISGYTFESNSANQGGAIRLEANASANISNAAFSSNKANVRGGAIYANCTALTNKLVIENSTFEKNSGDTGGALYLNTITTEVKSGAEFIENSVSSSITGQNTTINGCGGAIYATGAELTVKGGATFSKNSATSTISGSNDYYKGNGGAIYTSGGKLVVEDGATFSMNSASNTHKDGWRGNGGAIYSSQTTEFEMTGGTFEGNTAMCRGGAICFEAGVNKAFTISGGTFQYNSATQGGVIFTARTAEATMIQNVTMKYNSVEEKWGKTGNAYGGAIYMQGANAKLALKNVDITDNAHKGAQLTAETVNSRNTNGVDFVFGNTGNSVLHLKDNSFKGVVTWKAASGNAAKINYNGVALSIPATPTGQYVMDYTNSKLVTYTPSN